MNHKCIVKKISANKYLFKLFVGKHLLGRLVAIASNKIDFEIATFPLFRKCWIIEDIEVVNIFRNQGIGSILLKFSVDKLEKTNNLPIILVPPLNSWTNRLKAWYGRHGFVDDKRGFLIKEKQ